MSPREEILWRVRQGLGRSARPPVPPPPPVRLRMQDVPRVETMLARVSALAGKTHLATSPADARDYVASVVGARSVVASNAPFLWDCGVMAVLNPRTSTDRAELRALCATAEVGITSADYALADTGTLVMFSSPEEARMISLLPPVHIAVIARERILSGLDELLTLVPLPADYTSSMVLITGPSRTGDIEQTLVRGVHGPGEIHVVVV